MEESLDFMIRICSMMREISMVENVDQRKKSEREERNFPQKSRAEIYLKNTANVWV
jgi:hypothetical protein